MSYGPESIDRARRALSHLDPHDRDLWVKCAFAMKAEFGEDGYDTWYDWGAEHPRPESEVKATWKSAKAGGAFTYRSLIHLAAEKGFDKSQKSEKKLTPAEVEAMKVKRAAKRAEQLKLQQQAEDAAAVEAQRIWNDAAPAEVDGHNYLIQKAVAPHGVRIGDWSYESTDKNTGEIVKRTAEGVLLIPLLDTGRKIRSLQAIDKNGKKFMLQGGAAAGNFYPIGGKPQTDAKGRRIFLLAEGFATAASAHEATSHLVLTCFNTSGIRSVARSVRQRQPDAVIVLLADNDQGKEDGSNPGLTTAREAAKEVGGFVAIPTLVDAPDQKCDFNDLQRAEGLEAVASVIEAALAGSPMQPEPDSDPKPEGPTPVPAVQPAPVIAGEVVATLPATPTLRAWNEPVDPFGIHKPPPVPMDALPHVIAAYAADQAALMGIDPSFIAMPAVVAAASVIHDGIKLQPKRNDPTWLESARLWVALVGDPSTLKSPAISKATHHVRRLDAKLAQENEAEYARWREKHDDWKLEKKKDRDTPEPKAPPKLRMVVEDSTVEALSEVLKDNDRGVLCVRDELSGWIGSMDSYKASGSGADRAAWLETYNGGTRSIDRVTRGSIHVKNWSVCMVGGIQPDTMRRIAKNIGGDGLLQRFMPIIAMRAAAVGEDRAPDREAMERLSALFDQLAGIVPGKQVVTMTEPAHQARERIERHAKQMSAAFDNDHMRAWLGKWNGLFARLVLTFHVIECAEAHVHPSTQQVSGETAEKVERLMCGVLLHHAIHFYTNVIDAHDRQVHILQLARLVLAKKWSRMTMRDIAQQWKMTRKLELWETRAVIDSLVTMGWLEPDVEDIGLDRKPRSWDVNPAVHDRFTQQAEQERLRRKQAAQTLLALKATYSAGQDDIGELVE